MFNPSRTFGWILGGLAAGILAAGQAYGQAPAAPATPASRIIRAMRYPSISPDGTKIAFCYKGDIWTVPATGGSATRLLEQTGYETRPKWSPDGSTIAFCTDRAGQNDIYTIPAAGGTPKQVTFNSSEDMLGEWSADGQSIIFYSARDSRTPTVWSLRLADGRLRELVRDVQTLQTPYLSTDGSTLAYVRGSGAWARRGYRGSAQSDIYTIQVNRANALPRRLTTFTGNDLWPMLSPDGRTLYYTCDQSGESQLWKMPVTGGKPEMITRQTAGIIHYPSIARNGKKIVYETDFSLWTADLTARRVDPVRLQVSAAVADEVKTETRKFDTGSTEMEVAPDGSQVAIGARGDIYIVAAGGGEARRITHTLARDLDFAWSPDGKSLAYVSQRDGNTDIYVADVATGQSRRVTTSPDADTSPSFSPDGKLIGYLNGSNGRSICTIPVGGGTPKEVFRSGFISEPRWSPDGKWFAYSRRSLASVTNIYVVPATGGGEVNISRWVGLNSSPVWSPDGQRLTFLSTRGAAAGPGGPGRGAPVQASLDLYTVELTRSKSPVTAAAGGAGGASAPALGVQVDTQGIERRIRTLAASPTGVKSNPMYTPDGQSCLFTVAVQGQPSALYSVPAAGGNPTKIADNVSGIVRLSADGKVFWQLVPGIGSLRFFPSTGGTPTPVTYSCTQEYNSREERREAFNEAWLLLRDNFYDPKMHGVDWVGLRNRMLPIVDECTDINDFHLLLTEMVGELNASHTGASRGAPGGGGRPGGGGGGGGGTPSLGVWLDWSGDGPGMKVTGILRDGPADQDETRIKPGEYIFSVAGKDVAPTEEFIRTLTGLSGTVDLVVGEKQDKSGTRTLKYPLLARGRFTGLLYEHWVAENRERVDRLSGGRLAYLHIQQMDQGSLQRFERELITLAYDREAVVIDVRNNPGGRIHDDLFAILTKRVHAHETPRDGLKMTQPFGAFTRPMILLINQGSFSDAEIFANGFRENRLGKIVGLPTGGGVIGTNDRQLLDGQTRFRVPTTGWTDVTGRNMENYGVPPDIFLDITAEDALAGRDPQLERAVREMLAQLKLQAPRTVRADAR